MIRSLLILAALAAPAAAHDWYPRSCCSDQDCAPVPAGGISATAEGWFIPQSGEVIPFDSPLVKPTPPEGGGEFHRCSVAGLSEARTLCLFVPEVGA